MKHKNIIINLGMIVVPLPIIAVVSCSHLNNRDKQDTTDASPENAIIINETPGKSPRDNSEEKIHDANVQTQEAKTQEAKTQEANTQEANTQEAKTQEANTQEVKTVEANTQEVKTVEAILQKIPRRPIALKQATYYVKGDFTGFDMNALDVLRQLRNNESNVDWHVTGDNLVDAINDWRYAIWKAANGDKTAAIELSKIVKSADFYGYNGMSDKVSANNLVNTQSTTLKPTAGSTTVTGATNFAEAAKLSMKKFIDTQNPDVLRVSFDGSLDGKEWKGQDFSHYSPYSKMNPVVITNKMLGWAEYRSQQIDWRGSFDNHSWRTSNTELENRVRPDTSKPDWADAPLEIKNYPNRGKTGENYGSIPLIRDAVDTPKSISLYEGLATAFQFIIDDRDGTGTLGHRSNTLNPDYKSIGWSLDVTSDANSPYDPANISYVVAVNIQLSSLLSDTKNSTVDNSWLSIYDSLFNRNSSYEEMCDYLDNGVPEISKNLRDTVDPMFAADVVDRDSIITSVNKTLNSARLIYESNQVIFNAFDASTTRNAAENLYATFTDEKILESPVDGKKIETEVRDVLGSGLLALTI